MLFIMKKCLMQEYTTFYTMYESELCRYQLLHSRSSQLHVWLTFKLFEPPHDKTSKMACAPSEDSDQPGHPPSLIRVFAVRLMGS